MTRLEKIEEQIRALSRAEFASFLKWLRKFDASAWDRAIEEDAKAGKLDALADAPRTGLFLDRSVGLGGDLAPTPFVKWPDRAMPLT